MPTTRLGPSATPSKPYTFSRLRGSPQNTEFITSPICGDTGRRVSASPLCWPLFNRIIEVVIGDEVVYWCAPNAFAATVGIQGRVYTTSAKAGWSGRCPPVSPHAGITSLEA